MFKQLHSSQEKALVNLSMSSSVKEELASPKPGKKSLKRMLVGVKDAMRSWPIILQSRIKLGKSSFHKINSKLSYLNYLFYNLSSHMKD
jgi:hypothetical protein